MEPDVAGPRPAIADRTFRTVLRGYDPKEVRDYLEMLDRTAALGVDAEAQQRGEAIVAKATVEADRILADAQRRADDLQQESALRSWFGPDHAEPGDAAAAEASGQDRAAAIIGAAQAEAAAIVAAAHDQAASLHATPAGPARWDDLGEHVARVMGQAEAEARALVEAANAEVSAATIEADQQRAVAATVVAEAEAEAARIRAQAEADASRVVDQAAPRARAHIHEVLALAHDELDRTRSALVSTRGQLADVHAQIARSLTETEPIVDLADAESLVAPLLADLPQRADAVTVPASQLHHVIDLSSGEPSA